MEHNITLERAGSLLSGSLAPLGREAISVSRALGRVLAEDLRAERDFPPTSCAEVAGYAVRSADLSGAKASRPIRLTLRAGASISPGEAVAVGAGQPLPTGCDSVLPLADARTEGGEIAALRALWPYDNFIRQGEYCPGGAVLLHAGIRLSPAALALLTEAGCGAVSVLRRPKVALLSAGSPPAWEALLRANLERDGAEVTEEDGDLALCPAGCGLAELEGIFSGIKATPCEQVELYMRQGKPLVILPAALADADAAYVLLVAPFPLFFAGNFTLQPFAVAAALGTPFPRSSPVRRFVHGFLERGTVTLPEVRQSLSPVALAHCNCLVDIPAGSGPLDEGQPMRVLPLP